MKKPPSIFDARPEVKATRALADVLMSTLHGQPMDRACIACVDAAVRILKQGDPKLSASEALVKLADIVSRMHEAERTGVPQ